MHQDPLYADMAAMTEDERQNYLMDLMEEYLAGADDVRLATEKRDRIRSFSRPLATEN